MDSIRVQKFFGVQILIKFSLDLIGFGFEKFLGFGFGFKFTNPILKGLDLKLKNVDSHTSEDVTVVFQVCFTNL